MTSCVLKRISRRPWLSLAGLVIAAAFCFVLCYLMQYRSGLEKRLEDVRDSYDVICVVTDSRGVRSNGLSLSQYYMNFVQDQERGLGKYVAELLITLEMPVKTDLGSGTLVGVSGQKSYDPINPAMGGSCDYTVADFFGSHEDICLVPENAYQELAGREIAAKVKVPAMGGQDEYVERNYLVVGKYRGSGADLIVPLATAQKLSGSGGQARTSALSFILADNTKAEEMMEKAMEVFTVVDLDSYSSRPALTVQDRQYKATVAELEQNISRTDYLLPVSLLLSLAAGFMIGFLSVRGETKIYALMRTLGVSGKELVLMVLGEQVLLPALGALIIGLILKQPLGALLFFACHLLGCTLAVLRPARATPTKLLRQQE